MAPHQNHFNMAVQMRSGVSVKRYNVPPLRGSNFFIFMLCPISNRGQLLKKQICSPMSEFFPLRVDPIFKGQHCIEKQTGSNKSCFPL